MLQKNRKALIVLAITPGQDSVLIQEALDDSELEHQLLHIHNGLDLMDYLNHDGRWSLNDRLPDLVILDLDMPLKSGMEVLREIKQAPRLRRIPVIVLAGSNDRQILAECYRLGVSAAVIRGSRLLEFAELIRVSGKFWFRFVTAPLFSYEGDADVNPESHLSDSRHVPHLFWHPGRRSVRLSFEGRRNAAPPCPDYLQGDRTMDEKMEMQFKRILTTRLQQILPGLRDDFPARDAMSVRGPMDEADLACAGYEKEMAFRMRQHNHRALREIMEALERIEEGEFGDCEECGGKIGLERLKAHPTASVCMDCKRELEAAKRRTIAWKVSGSMLLQTG